MGKYDLDTPDPPRDERSTTVDTPTGVPRFTVTPERRGGKYGLDAPEPPRETGPDWSKFNKPFGTLTPADVSPTQQLKWKAMDAAIAAGAQPHVARHLGEAAVDLGSMTPMGSLLSAADLTYHAPRGEKVASGLDILGMLPGASYARRALRGTPTVIPAHTAPFRETRRAEPEIGGFVTPLPSEAQAAGRAGYQAIEQAPLVYHPNAMNEFTDVARNALPNPRIGTGVFTPEGAPNTHAMLERFGLAFPRGGPRPVNAYDFDTLRKQLLSQKGAEAAAGRQAADMLDTYMLRPPPGRLLQGQHLLPALEETYRAARGNWRGYKTAGAVVDAIDAARIGAAGEHSGKNLGNRQRQAFQKYVKTPEGEAKLFGATPAQLDAIEAVATGDRTTNLLRNTSNRLSGGGGAGQFVSGGIGGGVGALVGPFVGLSPAVGAAIGTSGVVGGGMLTRGLANARTARQAQQVSEDIIRSTPLYRENLANATARGMGPMADPRIRARDDIAMALMPGVRETGTDWINEVYTPYEYR